MKNKKLKSYVLPSLYACFFVGVLFVTIGIANVLTKKAPTNNTNEEINYVSESIVDDDEPVVKEENKILKPYTNDQVKIGKYYYDYKADETKQQNSITYHDNTYIYQSLSEVSVKKGDKVTAGQVIGKSGQNTLDKDMGNHLHFELYIRGEVVDPLNYLDKQVEKQDKTNETAKTEENTKTTDNNTNQEEE